MNFYLNLTPEQLSKATIHFEWFNKELDLNGSDLESSEEQQLYRASVPVAAVEMTYNVNATLYLDGAEVEKDRYSVAKYENRITSDKDFYDDYIEKMTAELGYNEKAKEKYIELLRLVLTMLDYGAKAQLVFDCNTDNLANGGISFFSDDVKSDMINSKSSYMTNDLENYGLEYVGTTVVYLSETTLRHYYRITDQAKFNEIKSGITFDGKYTVPLERGELISFGLKNIAASDLDTQYVLKIGDSEYRYSVMDYEKRVLGSNYDKKHTELAGAVYSFNEAANNYFVSASLAAEAENGIILGDVDGDGTVCISDATEIQKKLAHLPTRAFNEKAADIDGNGIDINDVTSIQRYLAMFDNPYNIGESFDGNTQDGVTEYESTLIL